MENSPTLLDDIGDNVDAFTSTSSTRKFPCCAKLGHGKSHDQVITNPIPLLSKLNLFWLVHNTYLRWIWSMTCTCNFANGLLTYDSVHFGQLEFFLFCFIAQTHGLYWNSTFLQWNPFYLSQISPNYATIDGFGYLWNVLDNHHPILHKCGKFKRISNYKRIVKVLVVRKTPIGASLIG